MSEKKMPLKDRLTICRKNTIPIRWPFYVGVCVLLLAGIIAMGVMGNQSKKVSAPTTLRSRNTYFRMTLIGNVEISSKIRTLATKTSYSSLFDNLSTYWIGSDYTVVSVAGPVLTYEASHYTSTRTGGQDACYLRPAALRGFSKAGIDILNFGNEYAYSYGVAGLTSTFRELTNYNMDYLGIAQSTSEPIYRVLNYECETADGTPQTRAIAVMAINDVIVAHSTVRDTKMGVVNSSLHALYTLAYEATQAADFVVVYINAGTSSGNEVTDDQQALAHDLIDAGADLVVGSHSNMVQPMERYGDGLIVYGLGDAVSDADFSTELDSAMVDFVVSKKGKVNVYVTPLRIENGVAQITDSTLYRERITKILTSGLNDGDYSITKDHQILVRLGELPEQPILQETKQVRFDETEAIFENDQNTTGTTRNITDAAQNYTDAA